jgi:hypothetical protein
VASNVGACLASSSVRLTRGVSRTQDREGSRPELRKAYVAAKASGCAETQDRARQRSGGRFRSPLRYLIEGEAASRGC